MGKKSRVKWTNRAKQYLDLKQKGLQGEAEGYRAKFLQRDGKFNRALNTAR